MKLFQKTRSDVDLEHTGEMKSSSPVDNVSGDFVPDEGAVPAETFVIGDGWEAKLQRVAGKMGVEVRKDIEDT